MSKVGYQICVLTYYKPHGGGLRKGAQWKIGQVILHVQPSLVDAQEVVDCTEKNSLK